MTTAIPSNPDNPTWVRISNIATRLRRRGHEVHLVHYVNVRRASYEEVMGGWQGDDSYVVTSVPGVHLSHLRKLLREKPDLVYANTHHGAFVSLLGKVTGVPLVFDMHGGLVEEFLFNQGPHWGWRRPWACAELLLDEFIDFTTLRLSTRILCVSHKMMDYLHRKKGIPREKMSYVTNGVDLSFFKPGDKEISLALREKMGLGGKRVFAYIGGYQKWQGVENLVETARGIDDSSVAFLIVGGPEMSKHGNLLFLPPVPRRELPAYYALADVLVLPRPSHLAMEITVPSKFAEYIAMGKPVLLSDVGDAALWVRKYDCGLVVADNTPGNLAEGIRRFSQLPEGELERLGRNSRKLAEEEFASEHVTA